MLRSYPLADIDVELLVPLEHDAWQLEEGQQEANHEPNCAIAAGCNSDTAGTVHLPADVVPAAADSDTCLMTNKSTHATLSAAEQVPQQSAAAAAEGQDRAASSTAVFSKEPATVQAALQDTCRAQSAVAAVASCTAVRGSVSPGSKLQEAATEPSVAAGDAFPRAAAEQSPLLQAAAVLCSRDVQLGFHDMVLYAQGCEQHEQAAKNFAAGSYAHLLLQFSPKAIYQLLGLPKAPQGVDTYKAATGLAAAAKEYVRQQAAAGSGVPASTAVAAQASSTAAAAAAAAQPTQSMSFLDSYLAAHAVRRLTRNTCRTYKKRALKMTAVQPRAAKQGKLASADACDLAGLQAASPAPGIADDTDAGSSNGSAAERDLAKALSMDEAFHQLVLLPAFVRSNLQRWLSSAPVDMSRAICGASFLNCLQALHFLPAQHDAVAAALLRVGDCRPGLDEQQACQAAKLAADRLAILRQFARVFAEGCAAGRYQEPAAAMVAL